MSDVIVEVRGGNVVEVYGRSQETRVTIVDWDNFEAGDMRPSVDTVSCLPNSALPAETRCVVAAAGIDLVG